MTTYPTNVSNGQWQIISKFLDIERNRKYALREIVNSILYLVKTGCQWRMFPGDFPKLQLVYNYFAIWKNNGVLEQIHESLVEKIRNQAGNNEEPSVGIIGAQSVKNTLLSSESKGFDAGKKIKGITRHIIVDTLGLILAVVIQSASIQDRDGAMDVIDKLFENWKKVIKIFALSGYRGKLIGTVKSKFQITLEIIMRDKMHAFKILPKRWIVERTFSWIGTNRRNLKIMKGLIKLPRQWCIYQLHELFSIVFKQHLSKKIDEFKVVSFWLMDVAFTTGFIKEIFSILSISKSGKNYIRKINLEIKSDNLPDSNPVIQEFKKLNKNLN